MSLSALFGKSETVAVARGLGEFRAARPVEIYSETNSIIALPVDGLTSGRLAAFREFCAPAVPRLVVTARRAMALGMVASAPVVLQLAPKSEASVIIHLAAAKAGAGNSLTAEVAGRAEIAAVELAKLAHVLPAVLRIEAAPGTVSHDATIMQVSAGAVGRFAKERVDALSIAADAEAPLASGVRARFIVFSSPGGESPVAVLIGAPDMAAPVPLRVHSACLTGDVFGSRRCDCGDQLSAAIQLLAAMGGGIVLYLPQEGRGLGLANKMRAYQLQDAGLDTVDANTTLGFDDDERQYAVAARMLNMLGCKRVILLTNNPAKLDGLANAGIEIAGRVSLETPVNVHNRRYLTAKAARSGHRLEGVLVRS
jgi:GTP cyclohydrolase II